MGIGSGVKRLVRRITPSGYVRAQTIRKRIQDELRMMLRFGARGILRLWRSRDAVRASAQAGQPPRAVSVADRFDDLAALIVETEALGAGPARGAHAVYLSPFLVQRLRLGAVLKGLPPDLGLKILRNPLSTSARYVHGPNRSMLQDHLTYDALGLVTLANAIALEGLGPRVVDSLALVFARGTHLAFAVEHVPSPVTTAAQFEEGLAGVRRLLESGDFQLMEPWGFAGADFQAPDGNGNFRCDAEGRVRYVDPQNFVFADYERYLGRRAEGWVPASHFGRKSMLRGGAYLYQSVPGTQRGAKRDTADREERYLAVLGRAGVSLHGRTVFDIGANIGRMSAFALREGALWAHLWDRAPTVAAARESLLLTGFTRFSTTGTDLTPDRPLAEDLPANLRVIEPADGVVFYLAIHHHVGWLEGLRALPWRHMLFEGPEEISTERLEAIFADLGRVVRGRLIATAWGRDGDSATRPYCVFERDA